MTMVTMGENAGQGGGGGHRYSLAVLSSVLNSTLRRIAKKYPDYNPTPVRRAPAGNFTYQIQHYSVRTCSGTAFSSPFRSMSHSIALCRPVLSPMKFTTQSRIAHIGTLNSPGEVLERAAQGRHQKSSALDCVLAPATAGKSGQGPTQRGRDQLTDLRTGAALDVAGDCRSNEEPETIAVASIIADSEVRGAP